MVTQGEDATGPERVRDSSRQSRAGFRDEDRDARWNPVREWPGGLMKKQRIGSVVVRPTEAVPSHLQLPLHASGRIGGQVPFSGRREH